MQGAGAVWNNNTPLKIREGRPTTTIICTNNGLISKVEPDFLQLFSDAEDFCESKKPVLNNLIDSQYHLISQKSPKMVSNAYLTSFAELKK